MPSPDRRSPLALVVRSRLYRGAALSLFFSGLGMSAALPQLSLFLVRELDASLEVAGLFFLTNLSAPVFGLLVGLWSERLGDRLTLFRAGAVAGTLGYLAMAWTDAIWLVFVLNVTVLGFAGAIGGLVFAAVRDELNRAPTGMDNRVMSTVRLAFSLGFMTGPVLGSVFGGLYGLRVALVAAAVATGLQLIWLIGVRIATDAGPPPDPASAPAAPRRRHVPARTGLAPLLIFLGLAVIAMSGDAVKFAFLPIYMADQLGSSDAVRGMVISLQSVGMVIFTPIAGALADRYGAPRVVMVSVAFGVLANVGFTIAGHEAVLAVATILNSMMWASLGGIGITVAQELHPTRVGLASSLYYSTLRFSGALGGIVGAVGVVRLGVPGVFVLPAALCLVAAIGLVAQALITRRRPPDRLASAGAVG